MPDASSKKISAAPQPPSRRGLPAVAPPGDSDDTASAWLRRLTADAWRIGEKMHRKALALSTDEDLTDLGKNRRLAKEVASEVSTFSERLSGEARRLDGQRRELGEAISAKVAAGAKLSEARQLEWRSALRGLPREELIATLRAAAAGELPASDEIMATIASTGSPLLLGLGVNEGGIIEGLVAEYRQSVAGQEVAKLGELNQIVADAAQAEAWLFQYAAELVGGEHQLFAAEAETQGWRPLSTLSTAEKSARVAAGVERGDADLRQSLYTPAPDEAPASKTPSIADFARFRALPLDQKVERGELGAGLSPAEIIAASSRAEE